MTAALDTIQTAIELDPDQAVFYQTRSSIYRTLGQQARAESDRRKYEALRAKEDARD